MVRGAGRAATPDRRATPVPPLPVEIQLRERSSVRRVFRRRPLADRDRRLDAAPLVAVPTTDVNTPAGASMSIGFWTFGKLTLRGPAVGGGVGHGSPYWHGLCPVSPRLARHAPTAHLPNRLATLRARERSAETVS